MAKYNIDYTDLNLDGLTTEAVYQLGRDYRDGKNGKCVDPELAKKYFQAAADTGYVNAQYNLACMYYNDLNPDYEKALYWHKKAAKQGDAGAHYILATAYYYAEIAGYDVDLAFEHAEKSACGGYRDALTLLEEMCGDDKISDKAIEYMTQRAEQDDPIVQAVWADCFYWGKAMEQDISKALFYAKKAAYAGNMNAVGIIARVYTNYPDVPPKLNPAADYPECSEEEKMAILPTIDEILKLSDMARTSGLLVFDDYIPESGDILTRIGLKLIADAVEHEYVKAIMEAYTASYAETGAEVLRQTVITRGVLMIQNGKNKKVMKEKLYALLGEDFARFADEDDEGGDDGGYDDSDDVETLMKKYFEQPEQELYCEKCETTNYIYNDMEPPYKCDNCGSLLEKEEAEVGKPDGGEGFISAIAQ